MENCSCVFVDVDNFSDFQSSKIQTARKKHECSECQSNITPFEKYEYVRGLWDGEFQVYKTCLDCLSIRDEFFCEGFFYTMIHEYLWEYVMETGGQIPEKCILSLTPGARDIVFEMIERYWNEDETP